MFSPLKPRLSRPAFFQRRSLSPFEAFRDTESYYSTPAYECTHWPNHPQRIDGDFGRDSYGDEGYSREELVAELGSAFLCADLELHQEPRDDNAAYIATWLEALKNDTCALKVLQFTFSGGFEPHSPR